MQISKSMPLVCAVAICAALIYAHAEDTPAQAAARAALMAKMNEMNAQQSGAPAAITPTPAPGQTRPAATSTDNEAQARALQALQQKMAEMDTQKSSMNSAAATPLNKETEAKALEALQQKMTELDVQQQQEAKAKATVTDNPAQTAAIAALAKKMHELDVQQAAMASVKPANTNYPGKSLGLKPIEAPAPPVSADKEAQLHALLAVYMADKISPAEYQKQRAAILAQP